MFGRKRREARRRAAALEAARLAEMQRTDFWDALHEVLNSPEAITLMVRGTKLNGRNGVCVISGEGRWCGPNWLWYEVEAYQQKLGPDYQVVGCAWVPVAQVPLSTAMDLASGYSAPRLHAIRYATQMVRVASEEDLEKYRAHLHDPTAHWIEVSRR